MKYFENKYWSWTNLGYYDQIKSIIIENDIQRNDHCNDILHLILLTYSHIRNVHQ